MKENAIQKINKIGKVSTIIILICKILVALGIAFLLLGAVLCFFIPKSGIRFAKEETGSIEVDVNKLGTYATDADLDRLCQELEAGAVSEIEAGAVDMTIDGDDFQISKVERTDYGIRMISETKVLSVDFHRMGWGLVVLALLLAMTQVTLYFIGFLCKAFRDCESPFEENVIKKMQHLAYALIPWTLASSLGGIVADNIIGSSKSIALSLDLGVVLIVLVVFLFVYIFKYGAILQQESDETL